MKKMLIGFILGAIATISVTTMAANTDIFQAQKATFDVFVNGEKFESQNPTIVVDGRTYLPLKETGDALGVNVQWNGGLKQVEVTNKTIEITVEDTYSNQGKNSAQLTTYTTPSGKQLEALKKDENIYIKVSSLTRNYDITSEFYNAIIENKTDSVILDGVTYIKLAHIEKFL